MTLSRRTAMKRVTAGVVAATLPGAGGCLSASNGSRATGRLHHASWLYSPETLGRSPHNAFYALDLATVESIEDDLRAPTVTKYANYVDHPGLDILAPTSVRIDGLLQVFPLGAGPVQGVVIAAANDPDELRADVRRTFDGRTAYRGFDVYPADGRPGAAIGIGDGRVLLGYPSASHDPADVLRALIDARTGAIDRYGEANPDFGRLLDALGEGQDISGFTHPPRRETAAARGVFENAVAKGHRYVFGPDTTRSRYGYVFATREDADPAAVRRWVDANDAPGDRLFGPYERVEVGSDGRVVTVNGILPTAAV